MGLDTSHDCWHGAYSAFMRWRNKLAEVAGYEVRPVKYKDGMTWDAADIPWSDIERENPNVYAGQWRTSPTDPLFVLLAHSDCDGEIGVEHLEPLANRLEELLPSLDGDGGGHIGDYRTKTQQFIDGLRLAASLGEAVDFH